MNQVMQHKNSLTNKILLIGIILIPFMSLPVMPSDYRPVSIFFFLPIGMLVLMNYLANLKIQKDVLILLIFLVLSSVFSIILVENLSKSIRGIAPLLTGILSYVAMKYYIQRNGITKLFDKYLCLFYFIAIIGVIEILSIYGFIPYIVKQFIGEVFSTKVSSRIQLITMEASWAAKVIIFSIPIYLYHYIKNGRFHKSFFVLIGLFILIFSLEGFAIVFTAFSLHILYKFVPIFLKITSLKYKLKYYLYAIFSIAIISLLISILLNTQSGYAISRIYKFLDADSFLQILSLDDSTFIRVIYPYIGFLIFFDNPFGVGLGGYASEFNHYITKIPVDYSKFGEVIGDIATVSADPKNLYSRIVSETGIVGILLFSFFVLLQLKYLRFNIKTLPRYKIFFISSFLLGLSCVIQFGSFAYLPFWFAFALNSGVYYRLQRGCAL